MSANRAIDWSLAANTAARLSSPGPATTIGEVETLASDLRQKAQAALPHVYHITGLGPYGHPSDCDVLVVDRATWAKANTQSFSAMLASTMGRLEAKLCQTSAVGSFGKRVSGVATGVQLGALLAFLSSKVLGQYDPFAPLAAGTIAPQAGRLLLVAPNVVSIERELSVDSDDFRMWVCLHEQTHRVQFAAAPWLREHMLAEIDKLSGLLLGNTDALREKVTAAIRAAFDSATGRAEEKAGPGILELIQGPEEKAALSHLTAMMSLLEGHANMVMDAVDSTIVPTVKTIRQRFGARSQGRSAIDRLLRSLLGIDAKMRQYTDGARFVRDVVDRVGMPTFNRVWDEAGNLPTEREIQEPERWIERMGA